MPVENTGEAGSADSHWRESVLVDELMTPQLNSGSNPLSAVTVQSLADLGYQVDVLGADPYSGVFTAPAFAPPRGRGHHRAGWGRRHRSEWRHQAGPDHGGGPTGTRRGAAPVTSEYQVWMGLVADGGRSRVCPSLSQLFVVKVN